MNDSINNTVLKDVLMGGNHLANALLSHGIDPLAVGNYDNALHTYAELWADIWVCWRKIMNLSEAMRNG